MIFVTVGTWRSGFARLVEAVDAAAGEGLFEGDEVLIQYGNTPEFEPQHCRGVPFLEESEFNRIVEESTIVICHAGAGSLVTALEAGKVPVVMPRRRRYGEVVNDHQIELANAFAKEGRIIVVEEPQDLPSAVAKAKSLSAKVNRDTPRLIEEVAEAVRESMEDIR